MTTPINCPIPTLQPPLVYTILSTSYAAFYAAIRGNEVEIVKYYVKNSININLIPPLETLLPIQMAIKLNQEKMIRHLLDSNADIYLFNSKGENAVFYACKSKNATIRKMIYDHRDAIGNTPLLNAVSVNNFELTKWLLNDGAALQARNKNNHGVLHLTDSTKMIEFLVSKKADVNAKDERGRTPLHYAALKNNPTTAELLIKLGAPVNSYDADGRRPVDVCHIYQKSPKLYALLKKNGAAHGTPSAKDFMLLTAGAWGISGISQIGNMTIRREGGSHFHHPFKVMSDVLKIYSKEDSFKEIYTALDEEMDSNFTLAYQAKKAQNKGLVILRSGWFGHFFAFVIYGGYIAICNRGEGGPSQFFKLKDTSLITEDVLNGFKTHIFHFKSDTSLHLEMIFKHLQVYKDDLCKFLEAHPQKSQTKPFCMISSTKSAVDTVLCLQKILDPKRICTIEEAHKEARANYKPITTFFRYSVILEYINQFYKKLIAKEEMDTDLLEKIQKKIGTAEWKKKRTHSDKFEEVRCVISKKLEELLNFLRNESKSPTKSESAEVKSPAHVGSL